MQEVTVPTTRIVKIAYYMVAIAFHWSFIFTNTGNYFHGGTPLQWIALEAIAVVIVAAAVGLVPKASMIEKILIAVCAAVPLISVVLTLIEALKTI